MRREKGGNEGAKMRRCEDVSRETKLGNCETGKLREEERLRELGKSEIETLKWESILKMILRGLEDTCFKLVIKAR